MNDSIQTQGEFDQAAEWRECADAGNPAGPLYSGGDYVEADIMGGDVEITIFNCTSCAECTGSVTINCN